MSDPADDPSGEANGGNPQPPMWAQARTASQPADEWVVSSDEDSTAPAEASPEAAAPSPGAAAASPEPDAAAREGRLIDVPALLTASPRLPWDGSDVEQGVAPATDVPADTSPFVQVPDEPLVAAPEPEPPAAEPVEARRPGVNQPLEPEPAPAAFPEPITAPVPSETTPTAFETVTDSTFTSEPEPAVASATEPSIPGTPGMVASITTEHPEYLIVAALIGGFLLAKVVKKLAR